MSKSGMKTDVEFASIEKRDLGCEGENSLLKRIKCFLEHVKFSEDI